MKKLLAAALFALAFVVPAHAEDDDVRYPIAQGSVMHPKVAANIARRPNVIASKVVKIRRGLLGEFLSPMGDYRAPLEACGYRVEYGSFWNAGGGADAEIAHSMAVFGALAGDSKRVFTIDAPIWSGGHQASNPRTANFPTAFHPSVHGAVNVPVKGGHIGAPDQAKRYILAMLGCGTEPPKRARRGR